jgi:release factor glutamine methyltransferase
MLAEALGVSDASLGLALEPAVDEAARDRFHCMIERRASREPLQHVLGHWPFLELDLLCDPRALVPRQETEDLAERARTWLRAAEPPRLAVDVGTGSGCLAVALAAGVPGARVLALDIDADALELAAENAVRAGVRERVALVRSDLLRGLSAARRRRVALIVANLPYVAPEEWEALAPEVRDHDPKRALVADERGLSLVRRLTASAAPRLRPGGRLILELAPSQIDEAAASLVEGGFEDPQVLDDRFGRPRFLIGSGPAGA